MRDNGQGHVSKLAELLQLALFNQPAEAMANTGEAPNGTDRTKSVSTVDRDGMHGTASGTNDLSKRVKHYRFSSFKPALDGYGKGYK